ncbi:hypothetical protein AVEN_197688-1 [Araneus ventricosus]|uniref:Uncharacterized protein n=1 Tax=Araneus ventricosus TaxID=182803 RepID=A0A4Y2CL54_ARAVE|nr:hypothetical protein AVEN_197688-1 [Araneus ventricosus]
MLFTIEVFTKNGNVPSAENKLLFQNAIISNWLNLVVSVSHIFENTKTYLLASDTFIDVIQRLPTCGTGTPKFPTCGTGTSGSQPLVRVPPVPNLWYGYPQVPNLWYGHPPSSQPVARVLPGSQPVLEAVATEIPRTPTNPRASTTGSLLSYAVCKGEQSTSEHLRHVKAGNLVAWREANLRWGKPLQSPDTKTLASPPKVFAKVHLPFPEYILRQPALDNYQGSPLLAVSSRWEDITVGDTRK